MSLRNKTIITVIFYILLTILMFPLMWKYPAAAVMFPLLIVCGLIHLGLYMYRRKAGAHDSLSQNSNAQEDVLFCDETHLLLYIRNILLLAAAVIYGFVAGDDSYFIFNILCSLVVFLMLLGLITSIVTTFFPSVLAVIYKVPAVIRYLGSTIIIALYIVLGALLPFAYQPSVSENTVDNFDSSDFYSDEASGERAAIISQNGEALEERIRLISQAEESVILSTFEFDADESGKMVMSALMEAADRGVHVYLIADGVPYLTAIWGNPYFLALAQNENVEIRIYNPINVLKPWTYMGRLHDKYLIVDDLGYILGGRNTYDYFLGDQEGYKNYDWDVLVYSEDATADTSLDQVLTYFYSVWDSSVCQTMEGGSFWNPSVIAAKEELYEVYEEMVEQHPDWLESIDYEEVTVSVNHIELVSNPTHTFAKEPVVFYTITELMLEAEESVTFHTPYIICNDWMLERLEMICDNVDNVTMMTNSVANNGNLFGASDYDRNKEKILETDVQILEYDGGVSYHGKCFVIDDRLCSIGSFNWDMRSVYVDTELMLVIDSEELNQQLRDGMLNYEDDALQVVDVETSIAPEGKEAQMVSNTNFILIHFLQLFSWARFVM